MRNRMKTRDRQREETKKRIYQEAFKLFDQYGYDKVKVSDIAKAAKVSVGSVYYHYKNKEAKMCIRDRYRWTLKK